MHAQTGRGKVLFAFYDNQLYTKLNKVGIDTDCSIPGSAQGTEK